MKQQQASKCSTTSRLLIRTKPAIRDTREFLTMITFSLRSLFGEVEHHSCQVRVGAIGSYSKEELCDGEIMDTSIMSVTCPTQSIQAVRAALTMASFPPYLTGILYRFDVLRVQEKAGLDDKTAVEP